MALSDLATAAYCPRQLYYQRRDDDREPPDEARDRQALAFRYEELRQADDATLRAAPIDVFPEEYRARLDRLAARDDWAALADPTDTRVYLRGRDCHGIAYKLLAGRGRESDDEPTPPVPTLVSPGEPPENGVWTRQTVRAVGLAKALAWEEKREIPRALVEYPAHGVVREVRLTTRKKAAYREALRSARSIDGPPPRLRDTSKCDACDYREQCGVKTRSLRSLLGL
nr:Dna2/Cas4 domain-containing protein [Salinirubrum litoreum]